MPKASDADGRWGSAHSEIPLSTPHALNANLTLTLTLEVKMLEYSEGRLTHEDHRDHTEASSNPDPNLDAGPKSPSTYTPHPNPDPNDRDHAEASPTLTLILTVTLRIMQRPPAACWMWPSRRHRRRT